MRRTRRVSRSPSPGTPLERPVRPRRSGSHVPPTVALLGALWVLPLIACSDAPPGDGERSLRVDTLAGGGLFVRNGPDGAWAPGTAWRLDEELRIGRTEGDGLDVFGHVTALTVDDAGRIWVADRLSAELRVFDSDGRPVRTVGRGGSGPGEFSPALMDVARAPDGSVWVSDPRQGRLQVFDTAGGFVTSHPMPRGRPPDEPIVFDSTGMFLHTMTDPGRGSPARFAVRRDPAGFEPIDTFPPVEPLAEPMRFSDREARGPEATVFAVRSIPFAHQPAWGLQPGTSHYVGWPGGGAYRFGRFHLDGDTLLLIEREYEPVPLPRDVVEEHLGGLPGPAAEALPAESVPEVYPAFDEVHRAPDGHWWVRRTVGRDRVAYEVFAPDGAFLGPVQSELDLSRFELMHLANDALYGVWLGPLDTPFVVRLAVNRDAPGG